MADIEALERLLHQRWSCRAYRPDPVPQEVIERIIRAAGRVPSWCNAQPWNLVVTSGAETDHFRKVLIEASNGTPSPDIDWPASYSGEYQARRREVGWQLYDAVGVKKGDREGASCQSAQNFHLFGAPHVAIVHAPRELGSYGAIDCGGFVTAFTLAATALGVASVPQAAVAAYAPMIRDHFGLEDDRIIVCAISFGYADMDHPANSFRTGRAKLSEITDFRG